MSISSKENVKAASTLCLKKVPTFKLSVNLSNLNRFSKFYTAGKRMKFATKPRTERQSARTSKKIKMVG